ncbi:MAG: hypothetical protein L3J69_12920 [Desulfobacula sp.]|nr:hypothetical protein [Desulfobacula sp.]
MTQNTPDIFRPLCDLYDRMDQSWNKIAKEVDFQCSGCKDNCCKSLFFHHTHIEKNYFLYGFSFLAPDKKIQFHKKAKQYVEKTFSHQKAGESQKIMCPVNENGYCLLYQYRPMICRLHGLPHEICRPGFDPIKGPGCDAGQFDEKNHFFLDRTPFYQQMARMEITFRSNMNSPGKIKETIAQILLSQ